MYKETIYVTAIEAITRIFMIECIVIALSEVSFIIICSFKQRKIKIKEILETIQSSRVNPLFSRLGAVYTKSTETPHSFVELLNSGSEILTKDGKTEKIFRLREGQCFLRGKGKEGKLSQLV